MPFRYPKILSLVVLLAIGAGVVYVVEPPGAAAAATPIALIATPVPLDPRDPAQSTVGRLRYMGGLVLKSSNRDFGGLSALRSGPDGRLLSISDTGNWISFVTVEKDGRLVGVRDGVIAPIRDTQGQVPAAKELGDAEGLEWNPATGEAIVSFEQDHRRQYYRGIDPAHPETLNTPAWQVKRDPRTANWPANSGGEAIADLGESWSNAATGGGGALGTNLALFSEDPQGTDGSNDLLIWLGNSTARLGFRPPVGFHPTDAMLLAPGKLLLVERKYSPFSGVAASVAEIDLAPALAAIAAHKAPPDAVLTATELAHIVPPLTVDNMEGLAIVRQGDRTFIYLVSDDNFGALQRTILLKFELLPD